MDGKLLIKEVATILDVAPSAIRYWEKMGLLHLQRDFENDYRYFDSKALLEVLDIVFFRKLQIPIKDLSKHLTSTVCEREEILVSVKKEIQELILKLQQSESLLNFRLDRIAEVKKLSETIGIKTNQKMNFTKIESLNLLHEKHTQQYLVDPSHFVLLIDGDVIREGIIVDEDETIDKYIIWQKNKEYQVVFGGLLTVDASNHNKNTLKEIIEDHLIDKYFNYVIAQYLSSGKENNRLVDYYKCWFIRE